MSSHAPTSLLVLADSPYSPYVTQISTPLQAHSLASFPECRIHICPPNAFWRVGGVCLFCNGVGWWKSLWCWFKDSASQQWLPLIKKAVLSCHVVPFSQIVNGFILQKQVTDCPQINLGPFFCIWDMDKIGLSLCWCSKSQSNLAGSNGVCYFFWCRDISQHIQTSQSGWFCSCNVKIPSSPPACNFMPTLLCDFTACLNLLCFST